MGKKEKKVSALAEDFQAVVALVDKLESFIKIHKEIAAGYQKYRKNGGAEIAELEKHLGIIEKTSAPVVKVKKPEKAKECEAPCEGIADKKSKKKDKKNTSTKVTKTAE